MLLCGLPLLVVLLQSPASPVDAAVKALDANQPGEAIRILEPEVAKTPDDIAAQFHLALAYSLANRDPQAIDTYRATLKLKPDLYEAHINLGQVLLRNKNYAEAETHLRQAVTAKPKEARPNLLLAQTLLAQSRPAEAASFFDAASAADPKSPDALAGLGRSLSLEKKPAQAAAAFEKALALDPANRDLLLEAATLQEAAGNKEAAIALYRRAPTEPAIAERLGNLLLETGKPAEAIEALKPVVAAAPTSGARYALAIAYLRNKQPDLAIPLAAKLVEDEPANPQLRVFLGRLLRDQHRYLPAAIQFQKAVQAQPDFADAWSELAGALVLAERYPEAVAALDQVKRVKGETPAYHYLRALSLDHLKQYQPALESYQAFLAVSKEQSPDEEFKARQRIIVIKKVLSK